MFVTESNAAKIVWALESEESAVMSIVYVTSFDNH